MSNNTLVEASSTQTRVVRSEIGNLKHVAVYGYSPGRMALQVRAEGRIHDHGQATYRTYSIASCNAEQARAVRDGINAWLREQQLGETAGLVVSADVEGIYREGWSDGADFDGDFATADEAIARATEDWESSMARRLYTLEGPT